MRRHRGFLPALGLLLLAPVQSLVAAQTDGEVTVMEPVFVEASSSDPWTYFRVPGFEVISHCPDSFNETYARALERATAARLAVLPASFWGDPPTPMKIVLYNRKPDRGDGFSRGSPIDLSWVSSEGGSLGPVSVVHSYPVSVGDGDTFINCGNYWDVRVGGDNFTVDPDSAIRIEERVPKLPSWFIAGMEGQFGIYPNLIFQSSVFTSSLVLPSAVWVSTGKTLALQAEAREARKDGNARVTTEMLPLGEIFGGGAGERAGDLWNSQAALVVRWGLYASGKRQAFLDFVDEAAREPTTEEQFRRHMGIGYDEALAQLGAYLPRAVAEPIRVPIATPPEGPLEIREASSVEIARIVGEWGRLEGRTLGMENLDYQRECLDQADRLFEKIYRRGNSDPLFLAAFGLYELQVGDSVRARDVLQRATDAGVVRPRAYVELARIRLEDALPTNQEGIGDLGEADFTEITGLLTTARVQMPSLLATYDVLARALEHAPRKLDLEQIRPLEEATVLFPRNAALAYRLANLCREMGLDDEAAAVIARAMRFADSDKSRALLSEFLSRKPG